MQNVRNTVYLNQRRKKEVCEKFSNYFDDPKRFLNNLFSNFIKNGNKTFALSKVLFIFKYLKIQKVSFPKMFSEFFRRATPRVSLNDFFAAGKKIQIPNPARHSKLTVVFLHEFVSFLKTKKNEECASAIFSEFEGLKKKQGFFFDSILAKKTALKINSYLSRSVYSTRVLKSEKYKNAFKKNNFYYI